MLVGSAPSELKLGTTTVTGVRRGAGLIYDSDVAAFQKASGATQVGPILALVDYLKAQNLWSVSRFYPMKSAQNAGSGSTVYGLGGRTSTNMTLVNSPTWGSDGVTFDAASSQYAKAADFLSGGDLFVFHKGSITTTGTYAFGQWSGDDNQRSFILGRHTTGHVRIWVSSDGIRASDSYIGEQYGTSVVTLVASYSSSGPPSLYREKASEPLTLYTGSPVTGRYNSSAPAVIMATESNAGVFTPPSSGKTVLTGFVLAALTTTQRETITDLINAL
jgi:hypothetical protein